MPRHKFVSRYRNYGCDDWLIVNNENVDEHLGTLKLTNIEVISGDAGDGFVAVTGKYHTSDMEGKYLEDLLTEKQIPNHRVSERAFWWGASRNKYFLWETAALRSFLSLFDNFEAIHVDDEGEGGTFGWVDTSSLSFGHAVSGKLVSYGNQSASNQLINKIKYWVEIGMPTLSNLELKVFSSNSFVEPSLNIVFQKKILG